MKKLLVLTIAMTLLFTLLVSCNWNNSSSGGNQPDSGENGDQNKPDTPDSGNQDNKPEGGNNDDVGEESGEAFKGNDDLAELCVLSSETATITAETAETAINVKLTSGGASKTHTVRVPVDENWDTVKVVQGKTTTYVKVYTKNGVSLVDFSMLSESDDAVITPALTKNEEKLESEFGMTLSNGTKIDTNYYPGYVRKSVTFTIDDGNIEYDTKFINIVKPAGIIGTFNLCRVTDTSEAEYLALYDGYEVANHHQLHALPFLDPADYYTETPFESILKDEIFNSSTADTDYAYKTATEGVYYINYHYFSSSYVGRVAWHKMATDEAYIEYTDITKDKIESVFGEGSVVGFAYPHGKLSDYVKQYMIDAGYLYARKTGNLKATTGFALPKDRFAWTYNADVSCMLSVMEQYDALADDGELKFFSFGVHSKDFVDKWNVLEEFAALYGNRPEDFWYASNRDIFEYEDAIKALDINEERIVNGSDVAVFITVNDEKVIIPANSIYYLDGKVKVTATFDPDNGTESKVEEMDIGSLVKIPTAPEKNGFTFEGWYVDGVKWNFNNRITAGMKLVAKYKANEFEGSSAEVLPVKGGAGGIVSIIHDDGRSPSGYILDNLFYKYDLVGDVALLASNVYNPTTGKTKAEYKNWKTIINTGRWGIINHSMTHTWWGNVTKDEAGNNIDWKEDADKMYVETVGAQEILRNLFPEHRILTYAYPGFAAECAGLTKQETFEIIFGQNARNLIDQHFIAARYAGETAPAYVDRDSNWMFIDGFFLSPSNINGTGTSSLLNRLESATNDGRIHMFSMHAVSDDVAAGTSGYTLSTVDVENAMKLISEYASSGKVWNTHFEDAILYVREAQNATVTVSGDEKSLTVILTDTMDDEIYNYPLTVRITVPGTWEYAKVKQGDSISYVKAKYLDGKWLVDADIVPDGGEAILTPIEKSDIPYVQAEKPAAPADSNSSNVVTPTTPPDSLLDKEVTVTFENDPGVTAGEYLIKEFVTRDDDKALRIADDDPQNGGTATIPLGKPVTVEAFSFFFDINVKNATSFATTLYFADSNKTPYMLKLAASGSGYYLGDCQSNNGAGVQTNNLTGTTPLEFNKWYTIRIDVIFPSVEDFKAVWYVDGVKTGQSTNRANYTKASDAPLQNVVSKFAMTTLSTAKLDMQLDNLVMKAGTAAKLGLDGSSILVGTGFENNSATVKVGDSSIVQTETVSRESGSDDKVLKVTKTVEGNTTVSISGTSSITNAKEFTAEFDIMLESSSGGTVAQIFFNTTIANSPIDLTLHGSESGIFFRSLNSYNGGTSYKFGDKDTYLAYNKYHHVKLHVVIGDANTFVATLYLNGENVGSTNVFLNPQKVEGYQPSKALNTVQFTWQKTSRVVGYIDNVSLVVK